MKLLILLTLTLLAYAQAQECVDVNCDDCSADPNACIACIAGFGFDVADTGACIGCAENCLSCSTDAAVCESCAAAFYADTDGACQACPENCASCPEGTCDGCNAGYYLDGGAACTGCTMVGCGVCDASGDGSGCEACLDAHYYDWASESCLDSGCNGSPGQIPLLLTSANGIDPPTVDSCQCPEPEAEEEVTDRRRRRKRQADGAPQRVAPGEECVVDPCADVTCDEGQVCQADTGECMCPLGPDPENPSALMAPGPEGCGEDPCLSLMVPIGGGRGNRGRGGPMPCIRHKKYHCVYIEEEPFAECHKCPQSSKRDPDDYTQCARGVGSSEYEEEEEEEEVVAR